MNQIGQKEYWIDETGNKVQVKRITALEKAKERDAAALLKKALKINEALIEFKEEIKMRSEAIFNQAMEEADVKDSKHKGNFTFYNFDRSIKVEVSISERVEFDDLKISACKAKLDEFLNQEIETKNQFVRELVMDAFQTTRGKLDTKKVFNLLRHETRVNKPLFTEAMNLLKEAITRPDSKQYFRIFERQEDGSYSNIELNFSAIK